MRDEWWKDLETDGGNTFDEWLYQSGNLVDQNLETSI
jgi:hypothetical protein